jgi:putative ABC transport system substrate-binding protein
LKSKYLSVPVVVLLWAAIVSPGAATQAPGKIARVGWMSRLAPAARDRNLEAFRLGMRELGYVEGQTFAIEPRYSDGRAERMPGLAVELESVGVDVIVAGPFEGLQAAAVSTSRVPLIMAPSADPVVAGLVKSLARPGGRITGITEMMPELTPKRLELLKQIVPTLSRVAILWQPGTLANDAVTRMVQDTQTAARAMNVQIRLIEVSGVNGFDAAFSQMAHEDINGLIVLSNPMFAVQRQAIVERAARQRLPAIYETTSFVELGGLVSYGADIPDVYRRTAGLVDKILKGAQPGDLPVEGPTHSDMGVNLKAARALGVTIPAAIIKQAVSVIE